MSWQRFRFDPTIDFGALLEPRAVFTHLRLGDLPAGGKKIYVMRDPVDVCPSYYEYVKTFGPVFFPEHTVDDAAELFMDGLMGSRGR